MPPALAAPLLCVVANVFYNLLFHILARFPGPKSTAASRWYEYYYQIYLGGRYSDHSYELYQLYGHIRRVNPFEVHMLDPGFHDTLYTSTRSGTSTPKCWRTYGNLYDTNKRDVGLMFDHFVPFPETDRGIQALMT